MIDVGSDDDRTDGIVEDAQGVDASWKRKGW